MDDLILDLFLVTYLPAAVDREVIEENDRTVEEQMASLRFHDLAAECPTNAGALLFASDPLRWMPGAAIQFVRWAGTTMADQPVGERRFSGDLITVLREVEAFVSLPARSHPVVESDLRERTALATLGYVNAFGRGVIRAQDALRRNGNPEAEFTFEATHVLATIRRPP